MDEAQKAVGCCQNRRRNRRNNLHNPLKGLFLRRIRLIRSMRINKDTGLATDDCGPCVDLFDVVADAVLTLVEILRTDLDFDLLGGVGYQIAQVVLYL